MLTIHRDPHYAFRFGDDRVIPRFHLAGVEAGRPVSVFRTDPVTGERLGLLAEAVVGEGGWVDLPEPIRVRAGDTFIAVPGVEPAPLSEPGGRMGVSGASENGRRKAPEQKHG